MWLGCAPVSKRLGIAPPLPSRESLHSHASEQAIDPGTLCAAQANDQADHGGLAARTWLPNEQYHWERAGEVCLGGRRFAARERQWGSRSRSEGRDQRLAKAQRKAAHKEAKAEQRRASTRKSAVSATTSRKASISPQLRARKLQGRAQLAAARQRKVDPRRDLRQEQCLKGAARAVAEAAPSQGSLNLEHGDRLTWAFGRLERWRDRAGVAS